MRKWCHFAIQMSQNNEYQYNTHSINMYFSLP
nr:MAG TPA: hypothetical protein [Caudoviricetes sp.]